MKTSIRLVAADNDAGASRKGVTQFLKTSWPVTLAVLIGIIYVARSQTPQTPVAEAPAPAVQSNAPALPPAAADLAAAPVIAAAPAAVSLSSNAAEVVRLAESGVSEDVILAYVQNSPAAYELSAEDVLYLKDVGLSSPVVAAMLTRDMALRTPGEVAVASNVPPAGLTSNFQTPPAPAPAPVQEASAAPAVEAAAPTYVSNPPAEVNYFYNDLTPYGSWVVLGSVGWCWQPRAVAIQRGWRPYCNDGRWVYSNCGWYWQSDYSWGWAPFHYGRWYMDARCGWVWCPDNVWGPAWVTWRVGGSSCGWAALPPRTVCGPNGVWRQNGVSVAVGADFGLNANQFTFVATKNMTAREVSRHQLAAPEARTFYSQSTVINNYTISGRTVVNHGPGLDRIMAATRTEIPRATVREVPPTSPRTSYATTTGSMVVTRTELKTPARAPRVVAQKVSEQNPVIQPAPLPTARPERPAVIGGRTLSPAVTPGPARPQPGAKPVPGRSPSGTTTRGKPSVASANTVTEPPAVTPAPSTRQTTPGNVSTFKPTTPGTPTRAADPRWRSTPAPAVIQTPSAASPSASPARPASSATSNSKATQNTGSQSASRTVQPAARPTLPTPTGPTGSR